MSLALWQKPKLPKYYSLKVITTTASNLIEKSGNVHVTFLKEGEGWRRDIYDLCSFVENSVFFEVYKEKRKFSWYFSNLDTSETKDWSASLCHSLNLLDYVISPSLGRPHRHTQCYSDNYLNPTSFGDINDDCPSNPKKSVLVVLLIGWRSNDSKINWITYREACISN